MHRSLSELLAALIVETEEQELGAPPPSAALLETLWEELRRAARTLYGDTCSIESSHDDDGCWHVSVVGSSPPCGPEATDGLSTYFEADGEDECGVLLEVAAFVSASEDGHVH